MRIFTLSLLFILLVINTESQTPTIGLLRHDQGSDDRGYVLFAPMSSTTTYLIDKCGKEVHSWPSTYTPGPVVYLLPDGSLLRTGNSANPHFSSGGQGGIIEKIDWNGNIIWSYAISDSLQCQHHDIMPMPNGNILVIAWDRKTKYEAIQAGRNPNLAPAEVHSEKILEIHPIGTDSAQIVWEWCLWDHLIQRFDSTKSNYGIVKNHPELVNINYLADSGFTELIHFNSVDYNPELDQILVSAHRFSELYVIDHSTTKLQAAGHTGGTHGKGGDLLYRWGNSSAYNTPGNVKLFKQHNARWIAKGLPNEGKIMVFNNGNNRPQGDYSSIDIINPPCDSLGNYSLTTTYGPDSAFWSYTDSIPLNFYAKGISGAQQMENGNILITDGPNGDFFEINYNKKKVWEYINPVSAFGILSQGALPGTNPVFWSMFYPYEYQAFSGKTLLPGNPIELNPLNYSCEINNFIKNPEIITSFKIFPNPSNGRFKLNISGISGKAIIAISDLSGRTILTEQITINNSFTKDFNLNLSKGIYNIKLTSNNVVTVERIIIQ